MARPIKMSNLTKKIPAHIAGIFYAIYFYCFSNFLVVIFPPE